LITENLSTLKIHKLTQAQYDRALEAGRIDENALYLTPDNEIDLSNYATKEYVDAPRTEFILSSSTEGSTKKFKLTIDDDGVLTTTEIVESEA
jgi:hypothetical protein